MKNRLILGIGLLLALLLGGLWIRCHMNRTHLALSQTLQKACDTALAGNWEEARQLARQADALWQAQHRPTAAFADQTPMDEVDGLFAQLRVFSAEAERPHFAAICAQLAQLTASMAESHHIRWWDFM